MTGLEARLTLSIVYASLLEVARATRKSEPSLARIANNAARAVHGPGANGRLTWSDLAWADGSADTIGLPKHKQISCLWGRLHRKQYVRTSYVGTQKQDPDWPDACRISYSLASAGRESSMAMSLNSLASKISPHSSHSTNSESSSRETIRTRGCLQA